jgi:hypothetical protein
MSINQTSLAYGTKMSGGSLRISGLNLTGNLSTVLGYDAGTLNTGKANTFVGYQVASHSRAGSSNLAVGYGCCIDLAGNANTVLGCDAGPVLSYGVANVLLGLAAGGRCVAGSSNVAVGTGAGVEGGADARDVAVGAGATCGGTGAVCVGARAVCSESDLCVVLGAGSLASESPGAVLLGAGLRCVGSNGALSVADRLVGGFDGSTASNYVLHARSDALVANGIVTARRPLQLCRESDGQPWWRWSVDERPPEAGGGGGMADLALRSASGARVTFTDDFSPGIFDFTAQHRCVWLPQPGPDLLVPEDLVGRIVVSSGAYCGLDGSAQVRIEEAVPCVTLCSRDKDPRVFGVIAGFESADDARRVFRLGNMRFDVARERDDAPARVIVNAAGEGAIWVCNANGPLRNGDLLTSSSHAGLGMRQRSRVVQSSTVAKITCDCDFAGHCPGPVVQEGALRRCLVGCVYKL